MPCHKIMKSKVLYFRRKQTTEHGLGCKKLHHQHGRSGGMSHILIVSYIAKQKRKASTLTTECRNTLAEWIPTMIKDNRTLLISKDVSRMNTDNHIWRRTRTTLTSPTKDSRQPPYIMYEFLWGFRNLWWWRMGLNDVWVVVQVLWLYDGKGVKIEGILRGLRVRYQPYCEDRVWLLFVARIQETDERLRHTIYSPHPHPPGG